MNLRTHEYSYWINLRKTNIIEYKKEKVTLAEQVLYVLDKRYSGFESDVEVTDIAASATYIRYTNIWKGSCHGWLPGPDVTGRSMKKTIPGLKNFYMYGNWEEPPGGIPRVIISAGQAVQLIFAFNIQKFIPGKSGNNSS